MCFAKTLRKYGFNEKQIKAWYNFLYRRYIKAHEIVAIYVYDGWIRFQTNKWNWEMLETSADRF